MEKLEVIIAVLCLLQPMLMVTAHHLSSPLASFELTPTAKGQLFSLKKEDGTVVLTGHLGLGSSNVSVETTQSGTCVELSSTGTTESEILEDCMDLGDAHWFGGAEQYHQYWPLDNVTFTEYSFVTKSQDSQAIAEPYWLSSKGVYIYVNPEVPLFIDMNNHVNNSLCLIAKSVAPYSTAREPILNYTVCTYEDAREAHQHAIMSVLGKPDGYPDERMIRYPIWSTWARYKRDVDEATVLEFSDEILAYGFNNSQLEIDDNWEQCYGSLNFSQYKFPNPKALTDALKAKGFRVTLWVHPFINFLCSPWESEAKSNGYFVYSEKNITLTVWWNGIGNIIDFTNPDAAEWFINRLKMLKEESGIDAFKFDAGETSWLPQPPHLNVSPSETPRIYTKNYVNAVSQFGSMIEIRVAQQSQNLPVFVRMLDKDSGWGWSNGLKTLVTTLLEMNMVGYPFVLPDMIGGNGYAGRPSKELFIRWLQANTFMPTLQFSYVPWDYDNETVEISKKYTELHALYADKIIELAMKAVQDGSPVNPPVWWIAPTDETAQIINDEFLLGEDILVAPVLEEGATSRDIYLPAGQWQDELRLETIVGPTWLYNYSVALDELAYFQKHISTLFQNIEAVLKEISMSYM